MAKKKKQAEEQARPEVPAETTKLPFWAKLTLTFFVLTVVFSIGTLATGAWWLSDLKTNMHNPKRMPVVAQQTARFSDPLPTDFVYDSAIPFFFGNAIVIRHPKDEMQFSFLRIPNPNKVSADVLAKQSAKQGPLRNKPMVVTADGHMPVGGEEMYYVVGDAYDPLNRPVREMVGVIVPKGTKETVLMIAAVPGTKFNMETTKQLLDSIHGF